MTTPETIYAELREVYDPEIPVNIVDLGLIYDVKVEGTKCAIQMTLTSQACPEARTIPEVMQRRVESLANIDVCEIELVWEPMWTPHCITPEGRKILGIEELPPPPGGDDPVTPQVEKG